MGVTRHVVYCRSYNLQLQETGKHAVLSSWKAWKEAMV